MTTSMRVAWQIALENGMITRSRYCALLEAQLDLIRRELTVSRSSADDRATMVQMQAEYHRYSAIVDADAVDPYTAKGGRQATRIDSSELSR
jgi:hypothetical protein